MENSQEKVECVFRDNVTAWQYKRAHPQDVVVRVAKSDKGPESYFLFLHSKQISLLPGNSLAPVLHELCFPQHLPSASFFPEATKSRGSESTSGFPELPLLSQESILLLNTPPPHTQHPLRIINTLNGSQILIKSTPFHLKHKKAICKQMYSLCRI